MRFGYRPRTAVRVTPNFLPAWLTLQSCQGWERIFPATPVLPPPPAPSTLLREMEGLAALRAGGMLTEDEFTNAKLSVLDFHAKEL